ATAALTGGSTGWTHTPSLVTTPAGGPYVSNPFSWAAATISSPHETVTGYDVAGGTDATALTFVDDSTAPAGGSVSVSGLGGTGGDWSTSTGLSVVLDKGSDAGSGLAASGAQLLEASAPLASADGTAEGGCGTFGSFAQVGAADPSSPVGVTVSDYRCYRFRYVVQDRVGNSTTYTSGDVRVETTAPAAPTAASIAAVTGAAYQYATGSTVFYNPAQAGSFTADSSTHDDDSGIAQV